MQGNLEISNNVNSIININGDFYNYGEINQEFNTTISRKSRKTELDIRVDGFLKGLESIFDELSQDKKKHFLEYIQYDILEYHKFYELG